LPKLIPRTHEDYGYNLRASAEVCALDQSSIYLTALPVSHNFALGCPGVLGTLHAGGQVVMTSDPSPDNAFALIEQHRVTVTALVPPLVISWLDADTSEADLSSLRLIQVGGAKLDAEVARRVRPALKCALQQVFGMAEGLLNYTRLDDPDEIVVTTQGRPLSPDDELRVVDDADRPVAPGEVGQLLTRGPYTLRGYFRAAEYNKTAFTSDGFYRTGDLVRMTPSGHLVVEGRAKDLINRGGDKVSAEEVESHMLAHPAVANVAVVSMPDEYLGERTCAFVIRRTEDLSLAKVTSFLRARGLAAYKLPDRLEFVDSFPVTSVGKVDKKVLAFRIAERLRHERAARTP
jgi:2,3-dihydroxybenzoate-AMP ligase